MINLNEGFSPPKSPKFKPGQIVAHIKYSYRGLVVESDETCKADETWYQSNQTQPDRKQPKSHGTIKQHNTSNSQVIATRSQMSFSAEEKRCATPSRSRLNPLGGGT